MTLTDVPAPCSGYRQGTVRKAGALRTKCVPSVLSAVIGLALGVQIMKRLGLVLGFALLGSPPCVAASPDQWKGLVVGEATPDQARDVLGNPKKESVERLYGGRIEPLLSDEIKSKTFARLEYGKIEGFSRVDLSFRDGKLVALVLIPQGDNKIMARDMSSIYDGVAFIALIEPQDLYNWNDLRKRVQRNYPTTYHIAAMTAKTFLVAVVMKGFGESTTSMITGADEHFPGKVIQIQYFSRSLEKPKAKNQTLQ